MPTTPEYSPMQAVQLFPLPLTAFEKYMLADDCPEYPMTFVIELRMTGEFREPQFRTALAEAIGRHVLLGAIVMRAGGRLCWSQGSISIPFAVSHSERHATTELYISLNRQPGLRIQVSVDAEAVTISLLFHHAATDGVGAIQFIGDLLGTYGRLTAAAGDDVPELATYHPNELLKRGRLWSKDSVPESRTKRTLALMLDFLTTIPAGIASNGHSLPQTRQRPFVTRVLDRQLMRDVKQMASRLGVNPNDLYIACLYRTLRTWNESRGRRATRETYRVAIPVSLRTPEHDLMPAANVLSFALISNRGAETFEPEALIKWIHLRMSMMMETADGRLFARVLQFVAKLPGAITLLTKSPVRFGTCVLANVGDVKRQLGCRFPLKKGKCVAGSLVLEGLYGAAPIRRGTAAGISLGTYAGELLINFNCDPKCFSDEQAVEFAELFIGQLRQFPGHLLRESA